MPGLPFEKLPAQRQDPWGILKKQQDQEYNYLKSQYYNEARALEHVPMGKQEFEQRASMLNAKHKALLNKFKLKAQQEAQQFQQVQMLVNQGNINEIAGREAMWRMVLPQETERAMFPTQKAQPQPYSMAQLGGAISESIMEFAEGAETDPSFTPFTREAQEQRTQAGLISQYMRWRELISYEQLSPVRQNQLDLMWDENMRADDRFNAWWADKDKRKPLAEVSAMRATGRVSRAMRDRIVDSATAMAGQVSPIGRSVRKVKVGPFAGFGVTTPIMAPTPKERPKPSAEQLRRLQTEEAYEEGIKLGYWTR